MSIIEKGGRTFNWGDIDCKNYGVDKIDENMLAIVNALSDKGIETYNCCEGHYQQEIPQILLMTELNNKIIDNVVKLDEYDILIERNHPYTSDTRCLIEIFFDKSKFSKAEFIEEKKRLLNELQTWISNF